MIDQLGADIMTTNTSHLLKQYQKENFIKEQTKQISIKEEFKNFLGEVMKNDVTIQDVKKVIEETI